RDSSRRASADGEPGGEGKPTCRDGICIAVRRVERVEVTAWPGLACSSPQSIQLSIHAHRFSVTLRPSRANVDDVDPPPRSRTPSPAAMKLSNPALPLVCVLAGLLGELRAQSGWIQRAPVQSPGARGANLIEYDLVRGVTVVFGGYNNAVIGGTWEW